MNWPFASDHRLILRSYLALAGGLMIAAVTLDLIFTQLQGRPADTWLKSAFQLIESRLLEAQSAERAQVTQRLSEQLKLGIQLLDAADLSASGDAGQAASELPQRLIGADDASYYLFRSAALHAAIRVGPVNERVDSSVAQWMPTLFYLSILVVVGWWLRPLLRDMNILTDASQRFATDYRVPLNTVHRTTKLRKLARNFDAMSARISHLIQSQKALTTALSHEMRTPLARIRFALAVIGTHSDEPTQRQLHDINADVTQIDALIARMLDYARLDHPDLRMNWRETAIEPWIQQALAVAAASGPELRLAGMDTTASAWMEPRLMELAISNLVANACRFAKHRVTVSFARSELGYRLCVEDDGEGIPEDQRMEIFKAYARLDNDANRTVHGFGLGLAIVARVAALHRGQVTAERSTALGGAQFVVNWPLHKQAAANV